MHNADTQMAKETICSHLPMGLARRSELIIIPNYNILFNTTTSQIIFDKEYLPVS